MRMGNIKIITLSDGTQRYKATIVRDKKVYRATFETEEEARKWLRKIHRKWKDKKIQAKLDSQNETNDTEEETEKHEKCIDSDELDPLDMFIDIINYVINEQLELKSRMNQIVNALHAI